MSFVPLRVRSHGSLLYGTASPEALIERALALGYRALALTDRDNLYLGIRFVQRCRAEGLTGLLGAEVVHRSGSALLLPLDRRGYAHLCALLSQRHLDPEFDLVRALAELAAGLHVVVESTGLAAALLAAGLRPAAAGGGGGTWLGMRGLPVERATLGRRLFEARRLGVPVVATGDVAMLWPREHDAHRAAVTAAAGELLERMPPSAFCAAEAWLAAPAEWARRVRAVCAGAGVPEAAEAALENNAVLASRCRLELELGTPILPKAPVPQGETGSGYLRRLGCDGVSRRYGADRVAMISTHATLGARSAFRETAKALGVPNARVNALARRVPRELERPYRDHLPALAEARGVDWREPVLARALELAEQLDGAPRHLSIHSGGVVIGDRPLTHYVPLERAAKGIVVTQFEMRAIEAVGLVKMDLLGNRALTTIGECVALAGEDAAIALDVDRLPDPDPATAARLEAGDTLACFQVESPAMRHLLRMVGARTLDDVIAAVALVRPGPAESGMKEAFCRRRRGLEPATFLHPRLEPVLRATHGVMLYEEDVMAVAAALLDLPLAEGDLLRRAIGGAHTEPERRALEHGFVARASTAGIDEPTARAVWRDLERFGSYAFCKAHAAGYGALAYQSAWLKTHHPAEYAVGILNHHAGMYETWVHVDDLRRAGVMFRAPCARRSAWDATLERDGGAAAVRVGLSRVFGLHAATAERAIDARARRPFASLADFMERVAPAPPELESLILAGALDWTGRTRPSLLVEARAAAAPRVARPAPVPALVAPDGAELLPPPLPPVAVPELPEFDLAERVRAECAATGLWFTAHPLQAWLAPEARRDAVPAGALPSLRGRRAVVVGRPCARRRVETRQGAAMLFLTLADESGVAECVLFPDRYRSLAGSLHGRALRAEGRVDETHGAVTLTVERVEPLA